GFGLGSVVARVRASADRRARVGAIALLSYGMLQVAAHVLLNSRSVNLRLLSHANPAVAEAALVRIRESGDAAALPALQQKMVEGSAQAPSLESTLLDTLTQLGGAKGWEDMLVSGRLGVGGDEAREWRYIVNNVREMSNPLYAAARGGVSSPYFRDADI